MNFDVPATPATDRQWLRLAISLAATVRGRVAPNPAVGAVLVRDGLLVGAGATAPPGGPHAEIVALQQAGERARGATLYVTLEPCAHYGRTPPCVDALIAAGIERAVIAVGDPNPLVDGRGFARLAAAGVRITRGLLAEEATALNSDFFTRLATGRPEVTAKFAASLDGRIATRTGDSRWITGEDARRHVHHLRDIHDAIMVGLGTVRADDPLLTTRLPDAAAGAGGPHHPLRVIVDSAARMPTTAAMLRPGTPGRTLVAVGDAAPAERVTALRRAGAEVVRFPVPDGRVDLGALLDHLGALGFNSVLVEGGATLLGALFDSGLVDRVAAYIAPLVIGGNGAPAAVGGEGPAVLADVHRLHNVDVIRLGSDILMTGRVRPLVGSEDSPCLPASSKRSGRWSRWSREAGTRR